jgi:hypothetical protein
MRFTIRDVLWLTALIAVTLGLGIGWLRDRYQLTTEINETNAFMHSELQRVNDAWENAVRSGLGSEPIPATLPEDKNRN